jgi:hypothetical protein
MYLGLDHRGPLGGRRHPFWKIVARQRQMDVLVASAQAA